MKSDKFIEKIAGVLIALSLPLLPFVFIFRGIKNLVTGSKVKGELEHFSFENFFILFFIILFSPFLLVIMIMEFFSD